MNLIKLFSLLTVIFLSFSVTAQSKTSVLKACFIRDGKPFIISTESEEDAEKYGFNKHRDENRFVRRMRVLVNSEQTGFFKPLDDNCITIYRIPPGRQEISIDFRSASYTALEVEKPFKTNFRANYLHEGEFSVIKGPVAKVKIFQHSNNVSLYQALDNEPVENCEKECDVPIGIPVYFRLRSLDERVQCPVQYEMIVRSEKEKDLKCYDNARIMKMLREYVRENNVECRVNIEYAFFRVFGEGCLVMMESDREGLRANPPEIRLIPLEKQRFRYFWKINEGEKTPYNFTGDRKGQERTPSEGDIIEFFEERNL